MLYHGGQIKHYAAHNNAKVFIIWWKNLGHLIEIKGTETMIEWKENQKENSFCSHLNMDVFLPYITTIVFLPMDIFPSDIFSSYYSIVMFLDE